MNPARSANVDQRDSVLGEPESPGRNGTASTLFPTVMGHMRKYSRPLAQFSKIALTLVLLCGWIEASLWTARADEVRLTNGDRLSGQVMSFSPQSIRLSTPYSGIIAIDPNQVQFLKTEAPVVVDLISGERVIGRIVCEDGKTVAIHSKTLGTRVLPLTAVADLQVSPPSAEPAGAITQDRLSAETLELRAKGNGAATPQTTTASHAQATVDHPQPVGQKPADDEDIRRLFLRQSSVLLDPGQIELEAGLTYFSEQTSQAILNARFRQFQVPLSLRAGLLDRLEGSLSIPYAHAEQTFSFADDSVSERSNGFGDALIGINYDLFRETALRPDIVVTLNLQAPTGDSPDESGLSIGSGHWAGSLGLQFIKTVDPIVLFWGVRYTHEFPATHYYNDGTYEVRPGPSLDYNFGFGFAVNDKISLSAQATGGYQDDSEVDGDAISGSSREPVSLRSALTYRISRSLLFEPSLTIGLNDDTPDFTIGLAAARRFGE
jgi:hypothetical protein